MNRSDDLLSTIQPGCRYCCLALRPEIVRAQDKPNDTVIPTMRGEGWMRRHESFNERVKQGNVDLLFIGDSITQGWENDPPRGGKQVWAEFYAKRNAMNLGISGDRTQHVLWRLENGNLEGIKPKLAMLMIGTNNAPPTPPSKSRPA